MAFMKNDKEERIKEREKDKIELKELISHGVKEEVTTALKPMQERQRHLEDVQSEMLKEFKVIKNSIDSNRADQFPSLPKQSFQPVQNPMPQAQRPSYTPALRNILHTEGHMTDIAGPNQAMDRSKVTDEEDARLSEIRFLARRTVGLHKIDEHDLVRMRQHQYGGAKTEEEERLFAVKEFFKCEMKIDGDTLEKMEIEEIFEPENTNLQCLFVTFKHLSSVSRIYEKTRCMRKDSRILNYIPAEYEERYRDIRAIEYTLRNEEQCQTRVKMGVLDLELSKKIKGTRRWERVTLPRGLQEVNLRKSPDKRGFTVQPSSISPAPGRPGQSDGRREKRGRVSTGSPTAPSKAAKTDIDDKEDEASEKPVEAEQVATDGREWNEKIEAAQLVGDATISPSKAGEGLVKKPDLGLFVSVVGTPVKQNQVQDLPTSPILSRSVKK